MLYMVIETYRDGPGPVYERAGEQGRMLPEGLRYIDSWVVDDGRLDRCYQLMETDDRGLLDASAKSAGPAIDARRGAVNCPERAISVKCYCWSQRVPRGSTMPSARSPTRSPPPVIATGQVNGEIRSDLAVDAIISWLVEQVHVMLRLGHDDVSADLGSYFHASPSASINH